MAHDDTERMMRELRDEINWLNAELHGAELEVARAERKYTVEEATDMIREAAAQGFMKAHEFYELQKRTCRNVSTWREYANYFQCSECGAEVVDGDGYHVGVLKDHEKRPWSYCPNCGARVEEE